MGAGAAVSRVFGAIRVLVIAAVLGTTFLGNAYEVDRDETSARFFRGLLDWAGVADRMSFKPAKIGRAAGHGRPVSAGEPANLTLVETILAGRPDVTLIPALEPTPPAPAVFPWPDPQRPGTHDAARLLRDALKLSVNVVTVKLALEVGWDEGAAMSRP